MNLDLGSKFQSGASVFRRFGPDEPGDAYTDEVESDHWCREYHERHRVASWRHHCRDDEDDEEGVLELTEEVACRNDLDLGKEKDHRRHLENDSQAEEHLDVQAEDLPNCGM